MGNPVRSCGTAARTVAIPQIHPLIHERWADLESARRPIMRLAIAAPRET